MNNELILILNVPFCSCSQLERIGQRVFYARVKKARENSKYQRKVEEKLLLRNHIISISNPRVGKFVMMIIIDYNNFQPPQLLTQQKVTVARKAFVNVILLIF